MKVNKLVKFLTATLLAATVLTAIAPKEVKADAKGETIGFFTENNMDIIISFDGSDISFEKGSLSEGDEFAEGMNLLIRNESKNPEDVLLLDFAGSLMPTSYGRENCLVNDNPDAKFYFDGFDNKTIKIKVVPIDNRIRLESVAGDYFGYYMISASGPICYNTAYSHDSVKYVLPEKVYLFMGLEISSDSQGKYIDGDKVPYLSYETKDGVEKCISYKYDARSGRVYFVIPELTSGKSWRTDFSEGSLKLVECDVETVSPSEYKKPAEEKVVEEVKHDEPKPAPAPVPVLTPAQQAKITQDSQAIVGSKAYTEKQAEVQKTVTTAIANLATLTPTQVQAISTTGFSVNLGGCTTLDRKTVVTMASNNTIPYNMGFTWNGIDFIVKVPKGANYLDLIDANGNLQMWKLVQKYGIAGATLAK